MPLFETPDIQLKVAADYWRVSKAAYHLSVRETETADREHAFSRDVIIVNLLTINNWW